MTLDAEARRLRGRIGAYRLHATHDPRETTAKARATFLASFRAQWRPTPRDFLNRRSSGGPEPP